VAMTGTTFQNKVVHGDSIDFLSGKASADNWYAREDFMDGKYGVNGTMVKADGTNVENVNLQLVDEIWPRLRVMARCQPEHKLCLVTAMMESQLHERMDEMIKLEKEHIRIAPDGQVVAVTGDGTNDAPSLKKADVGFAMGIAGTKVSKNACDIVLLDDNFASTVVAIKWGRNVYDSVAKFLQFQLTVNIVAIIVATVGAVVYQASPLGAIQMLWVNLIMDSLGSLALATEPPTEALLLRHPYGKTKTMISIPMWFNMLGQSFYQLIVVFLVMFTGENMFYDSSSDDFAIRIDGNVTTALSELKNGRVSGCEYTQHYTILFHVFVCMTLFNQVAARKLENEMNIFAGIFNNIYFLIIVGIEALMQFAFVQFLGKAVGCYDNGLTVYQHGLCLVFGLGCWLWQVVVNLVSDFGKPIMEKMEKDRMEMRRQGELSLGGQLLNKATELAPVPISARSASSARLGGYNKPSGDLS